MTGPLGSIRVAIAMTAAASPSGPLGLLGHAVQTLRLALPVMLARAGW